MKYRKKFSLEKKNAVVCGGLGLLGKETCIALAESGARVLCLDIDKKKGVAFQEECSATGLDVSFSYFDVAKLKDLKSTLATIYEDLGRIDVWVNSSYPRTEDWGEKLENIKVNSWQENIDMHMTSYCIATTEIAELMKNSGVKGSIINFGSIYGLISPDFEVYQGTKMTSAAPYAAIKGGIINFSRYVASYYGSHGIRVNAICPGGIFDNQNPAFVKNYNKRTLLKRMGNPEEIASTVVFMASEAASYITGSALVVDGGWTSI